MAQVSVVDFFSAVLELKLKNWQDLTEKFSIVLEDKESNKKELTITKQNSENPNLFIGEAMSSVISDGMTESERYILEVFQGTPEQVQKMNENFKELLTELACLPKVEKDCGIFERNGTMNFVIFSPYEDFMTLEEWNAYKKESKIASDILRKAEFRTESLVQAVIELVNWISIANRIPKVKTLTRELVAITPDNLNIVLSTNPNRMLFHKEHYGIEIKVDVLSRVFCKQHKEGIYPSDITKDTSVGFFAIGLIMYSAVSESTTNDLPLFGRLEAAERANLVETLRYIPGHTEFVAECLRTGHKDSEPEDILFCNLILIWKYLLLLIENEAPVPKNVDILGILTGLFFKKKAIRIKCIEIIYEKKLALKSILEVCHSKEKVMEAFVNSVSLYDKKMSPEMLCSTFENLNFILESYPLIKFKAAKLGIYRVLEKTYFLNEQSFRKEYIKFISVICFENTLTPNLILKRSQVFNNLLMEYTSECRGILPLLAFCGESSLATIQSFFQKGVFQTPYEALKLLHKVPIYFRRRFPDQALEFTIDLVNNIIRNYPSFSSKAVKEGLEMTYEIVYAGEHYCNSSNFSQCVKFNLEYNYSPVQAYCKTCKSYRCLSCSIHEKAEGHLIEYKLHPGTLKQCQCREEHEVTREELTIPKFENIKLITSLPIVNGEKFVFDTNQEGRHVRISSLDEVTIIHDSASVSIRFYYEVEIKNAGFEDSIVLGLQGTGICYNGQEGEIWSQKEKVESVPRFGSKDTVGMGITSNHIVFFTYNGYCVSYRESPFIQSTRPIIEVHGKNVILKVKFSEFLVSGEVFPKLGPRWNMILAREIEGWVQNLKREKGPRVCVEVRRRINQLLIDMADVIPIKISNYSQPEKPKNSPCPNCLLM